MSSNKLGETLRELRNHSGLTQEAVSHELHISRQVYSYYETGTRLPNLEMACRLAAYYHVTLDQLVLTGLRPVKKDPFASLPDGYRRLVQIYHGLSPENQKHAMSYLTFLSSEQG